MILNIFEIMNLEDLKTDSINKIESKLYKWMIIKIFKKQ